MVLLAVLVAAGPVVLLVTLTSRIDDTTRGRDEVEAVVETMAEESAAVADWYFAAPEAALAVTMSQLEARGSRTLIAADVRQLLANVLVPHPNLDGVFAARPNGSFAYVTHDETVDGSSYRVKEIDVDAAGRRVVDVTWTDENFEVITAEENVDDDYVPRSRSWYELVESGPSIAWTDPYTFYSSGEPGITLASAARDRDGEINLVVGVDLRLAELGRFLNARRPSANGAAMVLSASGLVVASSSPSSSDLDVEVERLGNPMPIADEIVLFRDPEHATTSAAAHVGARDSFVLLTTADDADFLAGLRSQFRREALLAVAVAAVSMGLFLGAAAWIGRYIHRLNQLASTDSLTGLPNRAVMRRTIEHEIGRGQPVAAMILDLDGFKAVNDTYGHAIGDGVLIEVANRLRSAVGNDAAVARLGGDEFIVVARSVPAVIDNTLWTSVIESTSAPYVVDGIGLAVSASGGVTYAVDPGGASAVLREADIALYEAKGRGGADYVIYDRDSRYVDNDCIGGQSVASTTSTGSPRPFSPSEAV